MENFELWRIGTVTQKVGLSRATIYRFISENRFPKSQPYKGSNRVFWLSSEIRQWQWEQLEAAIIG